MMLDRGPDYCQDPQRDTQYRNSAAPIFTAFVCVKPGDDVGNNSNDDHKSSDKEDTDEPEI